MPCIRTMYRGHKSDISRHQIMLCEGVSLIVRWVCSWDCNGWRGSVTDGRETIMRGIVAYYQDIHTEDQISNGVSPHVCATRGPDLRMVNDACDFSRSHELIRRSGGCGTVRKYGVASRIDGVF